MNDLKFVRFLTCAESNEILERQTYRGWSVYAALTDMDGEFGTPETMIRWERDGVVVEDRVPYPRGSAPCEHALYELVEEDEDDE